MHNEDDKYEKRQQTEYILILEQIIKQLKSTRKKLENQEEELTRCLTYLNRYKI